MRASIFALLLIIVATQSRAEFGLILISGDKMIAGNIEEIFFVDSTGGGDPDQLSCILLKENIALDTLRPLSIEILGNVLKITFDIPVGTAPGLYGLHLYSFALDRHWHYEPIKVFSKPIVTDPPVSTSTCFGEDILFEVEVLGTDYFEYQWYHGELLLEGETGNTLMLSSVGAADEGFYHCFIENAYGRDTATAELVVFPYQDEPGTPMGPTILCMGATECTYSLPADPLINRFTWKLLPVEAGALSPSGSSVEVQWSPDFAGEARIFAETGLGDCAGSNSDTLEVYLVGPSETPEICIVGMDEASDYYRIVWNKLEDGSIAAYNIYRESNQAGVFLKLRTIEAGALGVLVDSSSSPDIVPHSYKMSYLDTCGNESEFSPVHKTIHLAASLGVGGENNLAWNHYEGFPFLTYRIMRGAEEGSVEVLENVSSNVSSFSDKNPPPGQVFYRIEVSRDGVCQPEKDAAPDYSKAVSNVTEINRVGISGKESVSGVAIYPNPSSDFFHVTFEGSWNEGGNMDVHDLSGRQVVSFPIEGKSMKISTKDLSNGVYFLKITMGSDMLIRKLVVSR
ncbi:MAG: T9SS type A sorting domain-containing protein [Bacteroidetes bacterium]|nr:T9SS type A sorting domain-containing protein [Bacteroidota bacterium]